MGGLGMSLADIQELSSQAIDENSVTVRTYTGRVVRGQLQGARVVLKAYPKNVGAVGKEADRMASNELVAHAALQPPDAPRESASLCKLLGGLVVEAGAGQGEQWLVLRNDGVVTAVEYAAMAAAAGVRGVAVGEGQVWDQLDKSRPLRARKLFIIKMLRQVLEGLQHMHTLGWLHQSLGPSSVVLSTVQERDVATLQCRIRDLAFAVDARDSALLGGPTIAEIWAGARLSSADSKMDFAEELWRRAGNAGASTAFEKRNFGISDDIFAAGLLVATVVFSCLSEPGSVDAALLQRLFETTFKLDFEAIKDYAEADSRWSPAVEFLSAADNSGWELLAAMMNANWRLRPTTASCLVHPFLNGAGIQ